MINCDYANQGCPQFTCVEELKNHVANCGFSPVLCSKEECSMVTNKKDRNTTRLCFANIGNSSIMAVNKHRKM
jgi:hypothetical protein